jgi:fatty-acyl-CoA synthase
MSFIGKIQRELTLINGLQRTLKAYEPIEKGWPISVGKDVERVVDLYPDNIAIRFEGESWTYRQFDARANAYAHWALAQGLGKGDRVALFMSNQPDYVACWVGLSKIGVVVALINSHLTGGPLAHSLRISEARHVVASPDLIDAYRGVAANLPNDMRLWILGEDLSEALAAAPAERPAQSLRDAVSLEDLSLLVYTSGTTGAPKAAKLLNRRTLGMMRAFTGAGYAVPADKVYVTLPLYHGTGGLCGVGFALTTGATLIIKRKFSASQFWDDCIAEQATVFFYIGELCRYLLNQPESESDTRHQLRLGVGNGLRPEVWEQFQPRFKIKKLLEFYGSTEGNVSLMNFDGKIGSIGRIPKYLRKKVNVRIVKFDVETEQPVRGEDGLCIEAEAGEVGEAIGEIQDSARYRFEGYSGNEEQTQKKVLRDVFAKGDAWFRTGDLMRQDAEGYFYFIDRIGDTFRWKGENVSTNEVGEALARAPGVLEANVYGVKVGALDGRAGMAAITPGEGFDLAALRAHVARELPSYARPIFLRIKRDIDTTGTFKYRKVDLVADGFDPAKTSDPLYVDDPAAGAYAPLTPERARAIESGSVKL